MNFLQENIKIEVRLKKIVSYSNYIIIFLANFTHHFPVRPNVKQALIYLKHENDVNFQNIVPFMMVGIPPLW